jgi:hypothetical protein
MSTMTKAAPNGVDHDVNFMIDAEEGETGEGGIDRCGVVNLG